MQKSFALLWMLVVCLILGHNAYLWMVQRIVPETDIMALLPVQKRDPVLQQSFAHMTDAAQQRIIVLIGAKEWADAKHAADAFSDALKDNSALVTLSQLTDQTQNDWLSTFQAYRQVLLTPTQEDQLRTQPQQFWVDSALQNLYSPFSGFKPGAWRDDPFGLFAGWMQARAQETPVRPRDGYLFVANAERQYIVLSLLLNQPAFSISVQQSVMATLNNASRMAKRVVPTIEIITAGVVLHAAAASEQARSEMMTIGLGSLLGIILLTWMTFHSIKPILLILLSVVIGCLGSLSICWFLFGRIHLLTLVFGASLIGVAQDYGIYFLCNRLCDRSSEESTFTSEALLKRLMPSLSLTLLAAVIGYLGLAFTPFPGLRNMAVFSALGLLFAWLTVICWFPVLISDGAVKSKQVVQKLSNALIRYPRIERNKMSVMVGLCLVFFVIFGIARLGVNDDIRLLQNSPQQLISDQIKLSALLDAPTPVQFYLVRGATEEMVLEREEALKKRLDILIAQKKLTGYQALSNWVPSEQTQRVRRALSEEKLFNKEGPIAQLAKQIGEDADWSADMRTHLYQLGNASEKKLTIDAFLKTSAGEPWHYLWLGKIKDAKGEYASIVALRGLSTAHLPVVQQASAGMDGIQWVDKVAEISSILGLYRYTMGWVVMCSYLVVFGLLFTRYRRDTWRVLAPTALASITTLALLGLTHQSLQLFHVLGLMLLLGIGVDYGIFMQEKANVNKSTAWLAISLSAANTLLSFGLLGLSKTPALQAFGLTMLIGIALVWFMVPLFRKENG